MDCIHDLLSMGILQAQKYWHGFHFLLEVFRPRDQTGSPTLRQILYRLPGSLVKGGLITCDSAAVWDEGDRVSPLALPLGWCRYVYRVCMNALQRRESSVCVHTLVHPCGLGLPWSGGTRLFGWEASQLFQVTRDHLLRDPSGLKSKCTSPRKQPVDRCGLNFRTRIL